MTVSKIPGLNPSPSMESTNTSYQSCKSLSASSDFLCPDSILAFLLFKQLLVKGAKPIFTQDHKIVSLVKCRSNGLLEIASSTVPFTIIGRSLKSRLRTADESRSSFLLSSPLSLNFCCTTFSPHEQAADLNGPYKLSISCWTLVALGMPMTMIKPC